jgi:hypothetical protein
VQLAIDATTAPEGVGAGVRAVVGVAAGVVAAVGADEAAVDGVGEEPAAGEWPPHAVSSASARTPADDLSPDERVRTRGTLAEGTGQSEPVLIPPWQYLHHLGQGVENWTANRSPRV